MENSSLAFKPEDRYELHFGLVRAGLSIKGIVETRDMLSIRFDEADDTSMVSNLDGSEDWVGIDKEKNRAIIKYLCSRLGIKLFPSD